MRCSLLEDRILFLPLCLKVYLAVQTASLKGILSGVLRDTDGAGDVSDIRDLDSTTAFLIRAVE